MTAADQSDAPPRQDPGCIGRRVRQLREAQGLTQQQVADRIGMARSSIANIEGGRKGNLPISTLQRLAGALKTSVAELIGAAPADQSKWLELARRVTASERDYAARAERCWRDHDYLAAIRWRGVAEGLALARDHHLDVVADD